MNGRQAAGTAASGVDALTEKEKQTLRLLLAGHDAKSAARQLDLSVHTINERLRDARRKLSVSSSREAARMLREREGATPQSLGDTAFGDAAPPAPVQLPDRPDAGVRTIPRTAWAIGGLVMIPLFAAALALLAPTQTPTAPPPATAPAETEATKAARDWLALVDEARWPESWAATAASFREQNSVEAWRAASQKARVPLGRVVSRTLAAEQDVPAPPNGYRMVRFRTDYANRRGATETVALTRQDGEWKVVGCYIE